MLGTRPDKSGCFLSNALREEVAYYLTLERVHKTPLPASLCHRLLRKARIRRSYKEPWEIFSLGATALSDEKIIEFLVKPASSGDTAENISAWRLSKGQKGIFRDGKVIKIFAKDGLLAIASAETLLATLDCTKFSRENDLRLFAIFPGETQISLSP